jgi:hypothetical protein
MLIPLRANLFDKLTGVFAIRKVTGGGRVASTVNANANAGATSVTLASAADAADKDILLIGSGEEYEAVVQNGAPAGAVVTIFTGLKKAHVVGEAVAEGVAYDLGEVAQMRLMDAAERRDIESDTSRNPIGSALGFVGYGIGGRMQSIDPDHWALALGMPFAKVLGAGTQTDPKQLFTDGEDIGREPTFFVAAATDDEGNTIYAELDACDADYTRIALALSQGPETGLDAGWYARQHPRYIKGALNFLPDLTKRITRAHYPEALLDLGFFETDTSLGNTTIATAATTVDGTTFKVASGTGIAAGGFLLVSDGARSQIVWVESITPPDVTLRIRTKYVFAVGSSVVGLKQTRPGGAREGSTNFTVGGATRTVRFDNYRVEAGRRAGTSRFALNMAPTPFTLETLRRRLGLPSGAIAGSVLTVSDLVGTDAPVGAFAKVQRKDGKTAWIIINTVENTLASLELALSRTDMWAVPLEHTGRQVQFLQY